MSGVQCVSCRKMMSYLCFLKKLKAVVRRSGDLRPWILILTRLHMISVKKK